MAVCQGNHNLSNEVQIFHNILHNGWPMKFFIILRQVTYVVLCQTIFRHKLIIKLSWSLLGQKLWIFH